MLRIYMSKNRYQMIHFHSFILAYWHIFIIFLFFKGSFQICFAFSPVICAVSQGSSSCDVLSLCGEQNSERPVTSQEEPLISLCMSGPGVL